jgi:hypothetical protein
MRSVLVMTLLTFASTARAQSYPDGVRVSLNAGAGMMQRTMQSVTPEGPLALDTGWAPAAALGVGARAWHKQYFLRLDLHYETSLGLTLQNEVSSDGAPLRARAHRFEAGVAPGMHFRESVGLALRLAYGVRALGIVEEGSIGAFTLHGPVLRLELELPLLAGRLLLRVAPELGFIVSATEEFRVYSGVRGSGLAYGGEASIRAMVWKRVSLALRYREAHIRLAGGRQHEDIERFLLLHAALRCY